MSCASLCCVGSRHILCLINAFENVVKAQDVGRYAPGFPLLHVFTHVELCSRNGFCVGIQVGGRLVYSTCTFNPIEDEAVVAEVGSAQLSLRRVMLLHLPCSLEAASLHWHQLLSAQSPNPSADARIELMRRGLDGTRLSMPLVLSLGCFTGCSSSRGSIRLLFGWQVLRRTGGSMELLDVSEQLPELKRLPGLRTWKVKDQRQGFLSSWQEADQVPPCSLPARGSFKFMQVDCPQNPVSGSVAVVLSDFESEGASEHVLKFWELVDG